MNSHIYFFLETEQNRTMNDPIRAKLGPPTKPPRFPIQIKNDPLYTNKIFDEETTNEELQQFLDKNNKKLDASQPKEQLFTENSNKPLPNLLETMFQDQKDNTEPKNPDNQLQSKPISLTDQILNGRPQNYYRKTDDAFQAKQNTDTSNTREIDTDYMNMVKIMGLEKRLAASSEANAKLVKDNRVFKSGMEILVKEKDEMVYKMDTLRAQFDENLKFNTFAVKLFSELGVKKGRNDENEVVIYKQSVHTGTKMGSKNKLETVDINSLLKFIKINANKEYEIEQNARLEIENLPKDPRKNNFSPPTQLGPPINESTPLRPKTTHRVNKLFENKTTTNITNNVNILNVSFEVQCACENEVERRPWTKPAPIGGLKMAEKIRQRKLANVPIPTNELLTKAPAPVKLCDYVPDYDALHRNQTPER